MRVRVGYIPIGVSQLRVSSTEIMYVSSAAVDCAECVRSQVQYRTSLNDGWIDSESEIMHERWVLLINSLGLTEIVNRHLEQLCELLCERDVNEIGTTMWTARWTGMWIAIWTRFERNVNCYVNEMWTSVSTYGWTSMWTLV